MDRRDAHLTQVHRLIRQNALEPGDMIPDHGACRTDTLKVELEQERHRRDVRHRRADDSDVLQWTLRACFVRGMGDEVLRQVEARDWLSLRGTDIADGADAV